MTDGGNMELILRANTSALLSSKYPFTSSVIIMHQVPYLFGATRRPIYHCIHVTVGQTRVIASIMVAMDSVVSVKDNILTCVD